MFRSYLGEFNLDGQVAPLRSFLTVRLLNAVALVCLGTWQGCGNSEPSRAVAPVTGRVLLETAPVEGVFVYFTSGGAPYSVGRTDSSGRFELETPDMKATGGVVGPRRVTIQPDPAAAGKKSAPAIDQVYIDRSEYFVDVKPDEKNHFELRLKRNPKLDEWVNSEFSVAGAK